MKKSKSTDRVLEETIVDVDTLKLPISFDEGISNEQVKNNFYTYLIETYSSEYLDFYDEVIKFQNTPFEDESETKRSVDKITHKYLGMGQNEDVIISFNFDVLEEFQEKLAQNNLKNIFSQLLSEAKVVLKNQYHHFISGSGLLTTT